MATLAPLRGVVWGIVLGGLGWSAGCGVTRLDVIAENNSDLTSDGGGDSDGGANSDGGGDSNSNANSGGTGGTGSGGFAEMGGTAEQVVSFPVNQTRPECLQGTAPEYGDYHLRLRSTQACLAAGAKTVLGEYGQNIINGYFVDTVFPCVTSNSQSWTVSSYMGIQYNSVLINVATDSALDVKFQGVTAGTEIVLYDVTFGANQQYTLNARTDGTYGIENKNAEGFCVTASNGGVEIQPCDPANSQQGWEFIPEYCAVRTVGE